MISFPVWESIILIIIVIGTIMIMLKHLFSKGNSLEFHKKIIMLTIILILVWVAIFMIIMTIAGFK